MLNNRSPRKKNRTICGKNVKSPDCYFKTFLCNQLNILKATLLITRFRNEHRRTVLELLTWDLLSIRSIHSSQHSLKENERWRWSQFKTFHLCVCFSSICSVPCKWLFIIWQQLGSVTCWEGSFLPTTEQSGRSRQTDSTSRLTNSMMEGGHWPLFYHKQVCLHVVQQKSEAVLRQWIKLSMNPSTGDIGKLGGVQGHLP